jgi:uncharacterized protein involved in exopolysaccharide biosynthesis
MKTENPQLKNTMPTRKRGLFFINYLAQLKPSRLTIFTTVCLFSLFLSLSIVFLQPAVYQSYATLLTVTKTAIDQASKEADIQHVTIQKQILLGSELLTETANRLHEKDDEQTGVNLTPATIRDMLDVRPIIDTNLIEMVAEGDDPALLPRLINTWIDVYLDARAEEVARSKGSTIAMMQDELLTLTKKIELKRFELEQFRQQNAIVSAERQDNEAPARLKGLTESLNKASEEEVKAKARLDAIKKSVARGQAVVPNEDTRTLSALEKRAQELREQLEELDRQYTREYMALSPDLKVIPEKLDALENEIQHMRSKGQSIVMSEAEQEYAAARQTARSIQAQLDQHRQKAAEFTARFTQHDALKSDLEELEQLYRDTQSRLAQVEAQHTGKYPYVNVIEHAFLPHHPIGPSYLWNAIIATLASILLGLAAIWIFEFLTYKEQEKLAIHLSGIHLHNENNNLPSSSVNVTSTASKNLPQKPTQALEYSTTEEYTPKQIARLFHTADIKEQQLIILLLSGLKLDEIVNLQHDAIDLTNNLLRIESPTTRTIPLHPVLVTLYQEHGDCLIDSTGNRLNQKELEALLTCLQMDAKLRATDQIYAEALRHTYILYLIKQGIRLADLEPIVGSISPAELSQYGTYAPAEAEHSIEKINLFYPIKQKWKQNNSSSWFS